MKKLDGLQFRPNLEAATFVDSWMTKKKEKKFVTLNADKTRPVTMNSNGFYCWRPTAKIRIDNRPQKETVKVFSKLTISFAENVRICKRC